MTRALLVSIALVLASACTPRCEPVPPGALGELTDWERRFLSERRLPQVTSREFVRAEDGLELAFTDWESTNAPANVVLLVHGSSAHGALYATLGKALAENGIHTRVLDLRGHGHSRCVRPDDCVAQAVTEYTDDGVTWPGRPGDSADENQLTRDLQTHLQSLRTEFPAASIFLVGHSSGAGLVSRYVEMNGMSQLGGAVLLAPFLHADQPQNSLQSWDCGRVVGSSYARVDLGAIGDARRGNPHRYVLSLDKPEALTDPLDTLRYTFTTMTGMHVSNIDTAMRAFTGPTLWVSAEKDALFDLPVSRTVAERAPGLVGFVTALDTSHVGITWSVNVANVVSAFVKSPTARPRETSDGGP